VCHERPSETGIVLANVHATPAAQALQRHRLVREAQALHGADHQRGRDAGRRSAKGLRVGELAAEVETTDEAKHLTQSCAFAVAELLSEREARSLTKQQLPALLPQVRW
jgi:hypothetical protein